MRIRSVLSVLGFILVVVGLLMLCVLPISLSYDGEDAYALAVSGLLTVGVGAVGWYVNRKKSGELGAREGFMIVGLGWVVASLFGCLPFLITGAIPSFTDAYFEVVSGFTTTGATILTNVEALPEGLLFWRSLTQWIGGLGIILLSIAILPILGVGGMQLFQAEVPGISVEKLAPRISQTARILWMVYVLLTVVQMALLVGGGMTLFDAACHSFTTVSTGGFSTKNASIAHYQSSYIEQVIIVFMFLAGTSFALHYRALRGEWRSYVRDNEFTFYAVLVVLASLLVFLAIPFGERDELGKVVQAAVFQTVSILTTTGFVTADYELWFPAAQWILLMLMFAGACTGSTAGGIKLVRILVLLKNGINQLKMLIHPRAILPVRHNGKSLDQEIIIDILTFFILFVLIFIVASLAMTALGMDIVSSAGAVAASLGNIGPGLGSVGAVDNYAHVPMIGKWILVFCMLTGRLEIFTIIVLLTPAFWRR
ncbi:MAG: TrkH family potassium uptake protein [Ignavibacteria bacterium]|nr:TrkH family potassium uptake protein [Ignavibacteria bacterium]